MDGLTPKDDSTAGKKRLGVITRAGDDYLRSLLVAGATSVIKQVLAGKRQPSPWLAALLGRKPVKLAAVALANKSARVAWKLMISGDYYDPSRYHAGEAAELGAREVRAPARRTGPGRAPRSSAAASRSASAASHPRKPLWRTHEQFWRESNPRFALRPALARSAADGVIDRSENVRYSVGPSGKQSKPQPCLDLRREPHLGSGHV